MLPLVICPAVIVLLYKFFGDPFHRWGTWQNSIAALSFITLNHYQIIDIVGGSNVPMPGSARSAFDVWAFTNNIASVFKTDCVGMADFTSMMVARGLYPVAAAFFCLVTFGISFLLSRLLRRSELQMQRDRLLNVFGSIMFSFFSAIAASSLLLFKCSSNPNGKKTLTTDLSIICFESDEWKKMVGVGVVFVLVYIFGMGGLFVRTVIVAPKYFHDPGFQMRWKFLFIKFRSDVYWWGVVFLAKNFLVNLAFVAAVAGLAQLYFTMTVTVAYMGGVILLLPYRARIANLLEVLAGTSILYVCSLLTWHADHDNGEHDAGVAWATIIISISPVVFGVFSAGWVYWYGTAIPFTVTEVSRAEREFRLIKRSMEALVVLDASAGSNMLLRLGEWDRWYLSAAAAALRTDVVGGGPHNSFRVVDTQLQEDMGKVLSEAKTRQSNRVGAANTIVV